MPGKFPPEAIVGSRVVKSGLGRVDFEMKWLNCSESENTWKPRESLGHCKSHYFERNLK